MYEYTEIKSIPQWLFMYAIQIRLLSCEERPPLEIYLKYFTQRRGLLKWAYGLACEEMNTVLGSRI